MFYTERDITIPLTFNDEVNALTAQDIRFTLTKPAGNVLVVDKRKTTGGIVVVDATNANVLINETEVVDAGNYRLEIYLIDQLGDIRALTPTTITSTLGNTSNLLGNNPQVCFIKSYYTE